jgi:hypothetical protein
MFFSVPFTFVPHLNKDKQVIPMLRELRMASSSLGYVKGICLKKSNQTKKKP